MLKDLEKAATKEKGIPLQTVKDVLTSLVSDDMVDTDKIGTSVYFWSFPSKNSTIVSTASMWFDFLLLIAMFCLTRKQTKSKS